MSSLIVLSVILALGLYIPLCVQIFTGKVKQNMATWLLWGLIDGVAAGSLIVQHGNYLLPAGYTLGAVITTLFIIRSKSITWTWFESLVTVLVVICIIIWALSGPKMATVASTLAMVIAGIPQLFETYRKPHDTPLIIYTGYIIANGLSAMGAKDWSIEERFYPVCATIYCVAISVLASRKLWLKPQQTALSS